MSVLRASKWATFIFAGIALAAYIAVGGFSIFGPAHDDFWHTVTPGNVAITMGPNGGISHVKSWVATWYVCSTWIFVVSVSLSLCTGLLYLRLAYKSGEPPFN